jgi:NADPH-dependent 7-cyano-7-deazaguanine reductase QueF
MNLLTQPNERRCTSTKEGHKLMLPVCCPYSQNPRPGSSIRINYIPAETLLEVASLHAYIDSYRGGRGEVRSMEGMIQNITKDCADTLGVHVEVTAELLLDPSQTMYLTCQHG